MNSDAVKKGATRAAHRALFHAMGYGPEDLEKPLIGCLLVVQVLVTFIPAISLTLPKLILG